MLVSGLPNTDLGCARNPCAEHRKSNASSLAVFAVEFLHGAGTVSQPHNEIRSSCDVSEASKSTGCKLDFHALAQGLSLHVRSTRVHHTVASYAQGWRTVFLANCKG